MRARFAVTALAVITLSGFSGMYLGWQASAAAQQPITIRAGTVLDGKGGVQRNAVITIEGMRIVKLGDSQPEILTYDLSRLTVLPGLIDTMFISASTSAPLRRQYPKEEPGALAAHAGTCARAGSNPRPYRDRLVLSELDFRAASDR